MAGVLKRRRQLYRESWPWLLHRRYSTGLSAKYRLMRL